MTDAAYLKKSIPALKNIAVRWCHKYIRLRDEGQPCISCGNYRTLEAGHFYSGGKFSMLKYDEDNIHGQCKQCNFYGGQEIGANYDINLRKKIGDERIDKLHMTAKINKRTRYKFDRFTLIETIRKYQRKCKEVRA